MKEENRIVTYGRATSWLVRAGGNILSFGTRPDLFVPLNADTMARWLTAKGVSLNEAMQHTSPARYLVDHGLKHSFPTLKTYQEKNLSDALRAAKRLGILVETDAVARRRLLDTALNTRTQSGYGMLFQADEACRREARILPIATAAQDLVASSRQGLHLRQVSDSFSCMARDTQTYDRYLVRMWDNPDVATRERRNVQLLANEGGELVDAFAVKLRRLSKRGALKGGKVHWCVLQKMPHGTLGDLAQSMTQRNMTVADKAWNLLYLASEALAKAHAVARVHGQVSPDALWIYRQQGAHGMELRCSCAHSIVTEEQASGSELAAAPLEMTEGLRRTSAPESRGTPKRKAAAASDVWSLAAVVLELATGEPMGGDSMSQTQRDLLLEAQNQDLIDLLEAMLNDRRELRTPAAQVRDAAKQKLRGNTALSGLAQSRGNSRFDEVADLLVDSMD